MGDATHDPNSSSRETSQRRGPFASELMRLKRRGCCVLVTGRVSDRVRAAQSRQLFGEIDESRQRVLALTDAAPADTSRYLPDGIPPTHQNVTVLDYTEMVRAGVTDTPPPSTDTQSDSHFRSEGSDHKRGLATTLRASVGPAIRNDSVAPGELRFGIATLGALISADGLSPTQAFVRAVRTDVLSMHGMGHFHLPGVPDTDTLNALRSVTDIHLELRESQRHGPEHRWHLLEANYSTDWFPM